MISPCPPISIILITHDNLENCRRCLSAVDAHLRVRPAPLQNYELLLVDSETSTEISQFLNQFAAAASTRGAAVHIIKPRQARLAISPAELYNRGAQAANGEIFILLTDDCVPADGWLEALLDHANKPPVGVVVPVTNWASTRSRILVEYQGLEEMPAFAARLTQNHRGETTALESVEFFCAALRKDTYKKIGPLDENFGTLLFASQDYCQRLKQKELSCLCAEDSFVHRESAVQQETSRKDLAVIKHPHDDSALEIVSAGKEFADYRQYAKDWRYYEQKWGQTWRPALPRIELVAIQSAEALSAQMQLVALADEQQQKIAELEEKNTWLDKEYSRAVIALHSIQNSSSWRVMQVIWGIRHRLAPRHSDREQFVKRISRALTTLLPKISLRMLLLRHLSARGIVIFAPTIHWQVTLFQRPQQLALALARLGYLVIYCEPPGSREFDAGFYRIQERLYVYVKDPLEILKAIRSPTVFVLAYNHQTLANFSNPSVVYEYIDELSVFPGDQAELQRSHLELVRSADIVVATADKLYQEIHAQRPDALFCPNAVDYEFIRSIMQNTTQPPEDIQDLVALGKPIIGYYGALARWFDYDLVAQAARARPDYQFLLIGPDYDQTIKDKLLHLPNIRWLGARPYADIPRYLKYLDSTTIPFVLNEITHATSPLKLFEYMTGEKPIVTTAMHECAKYPVVLIAEDADDYAAKLDQALQQRSNPQYLEQLRQTALQNTWDQRARQIMEAVEKSQRSAALPMKSNG